MLCDVITASWDDQIKRLCEVCAILAQVNKINKCARRKRKGKLLNLRSHLVISRDKYAAQGLGIANLEKNHYPLYIISCHGPEGHKQMKKVRHL